MTVARKDAGMRLSSYIREKLGVSAKKAQEAIHNGHCSVNGKRERFASYKVVVGDRIECRFLEKTTTEYTVLFEDDSLLVIDKPAGIVCSAKQFPSYFLVHRLDKETSGVLLLPKAKNVYEILRAQFAKRLVHKVYLAVVEGAPRNDTWNVENRLGAVKQFHGQTVYGETRDGKEASTSFATLKRGKHSLIQCRPHTGRTHQIRVHLAASGFPVVGDMLYSSKTRSVDRHLLHAYQVTLNHPKTDESMTFTAPVPKEFLVK